MATLRLKNKDWLEEQHAPIERREYTLDMNEEEQMFKAEDLVYSDPNRAIYRDEKKTL
jgi:hypothetical protein